ncbi:MAG: ribonuclease HI [Candidatus Azotimanducaceae bacterium]
MGKQKFYVVWVGRETGIFTDWSSTQQLVSGFPKSRFKSFPTMEEARSAFTNGPTVSKPSAKKTPNAKSAGKGQKSGFELDSNFDVHIFCDGGCDPNPGKSGSGVAVYENGELIARYYGLYNPMGTNNTAELSALFEAMKLSKAFLLAKKKVQILADSTYAIKAMTTWGADWQKRGWKRKTGDLVNAELIALMYACYLDIKSEISIQHVKAHIGTQGNELADRLSLLTLETKEKEFKLYRGNLDIAGMLKMGTS